MRPRRGNSLLEVIAASTVIALALVPALSLLQRAVAVGEQTETADVVATLAASRLEETLAKTAGNWNTVAESGNYASLGYSRMKYSVAKSDDPASGGIADRLLAITVTVWDDADNDGLAGTAEPKAQFSTKLAKIASYTEGT